MEENRQDKIASLVKNDGWIELKKIIEEKIEALKKMIDPLTGQSMITGEESVEQIGFKYLIVSAVINYLEEIKELPALLDERGKK